MLTWTARVGRQTRRNDVDERRTRNATEYRPNFSINEQIRSSTSNEWHQRKRTVQFDHEQTERTELADMLIQFSRSLDRRSRRKQKKQTFNGIIERARRFGRCHPIKIHFFHSPYIRNLCFFLRISHADLVCFLHFISSRRFAIDKDKTKRGRCSRSNRKMEMKKRPFVLISDYDMLFRSMIERFWVFQFR